MLFRPWVKPCQPSRLRCPPALSRAGGGGVRIQAQVNDQIDAEQTDCVKSAHQRQKRNGQNAEPRYQHLFRRCVAMAAQLLCCQKPWECNDNATTVISSFFFSFFPCLVPSYPYNRSSVEQRTKKDAFIVFCRKGQFTPVNPRAHYFLPSSCQCVTQWLLAVLWRTRSC